MVVVLELTCTSRNTCYIHYKKEKETFAAENTVIFNFLIGKPSTCGCYHVEVFFFSIMWESQRTTLSCKGFAYKEEKSKNYPLFWK